MRARRGVYTAIFLAAAIGAMALVYLAQPRNGIVRAKTDIAVLTPITAEMVEVVTVSPADAPANAARSLDAVVGRYTSVGILAGSRYGPCQRSALLAGGETSACSPSDVEG